ncbi:MAG TPA: WGR domain-containing protein [Candidatus Saccharimonadales bacterium]|nr:WGR domain-containing protein [Candidatus Saccharimonadales bacterium]
MSLSAENPFSKSLEPSQEHGGLETDDVLSIVLPLMRQVLVLHASAQVAPLKGIHNLLLKDGRHLTFDPAKVSPPTKNASRLAQLQAPLSNAVEVVAESRHTSDIDAASLVVSNLGIGKSGHEITKPVYLPDYISWEHAVGHHDELTDIFSLGLILASYACGLDFTDHTDLETFANSRDNLFRLNSRLNPVLASVIAQMTELNRHKRAQDLAALIRRLETYREQPLDFDTTFTRMKGFKDSPAAGKRRIIQSHLRDRLFEISRRNRLIHFKPTLQTLNLTLASVPLVMDYRNIALEQLFVWHPQIAATIRDGGAMSLGKYLRFEDAPYIPGVLDKIISEARRDRAEYGFAQLRLVLCFLRWHNLKETPQERIHSPLLLLPVELVKKKGVRDNYVLTPASSEAEVNPALRHHLKELYGLDLPEFVDLKDTTLDEFYDLIKARIHATEPGVTLNKIDRPQIELIHARARQRVDQYRRRMKLKARPVRSSSTADYSYARENFRPLGLKLFLEKIRPTPAPLRDVAGAPPTPRAPMIVPAEPTAEGGKVLETERQMFSIREGENQNPYSWDFDLCSLTLDNFNYRKMTLVRDYSNLIESDVASAAFENIFSLSPKQAELEAPAALDLADQHTIISCDATQASAIALARTGRSYIIQGPPGTGKSQTITNLIADYVARGKRVLFVCEKRAAIDIVFHRLRQQGLDELCCLIHDSQTDKKAFIQNLKQTYETFLAQGEGDADAARDRKAALHAMEQDLATLKRYSEAMRTAYTQTGIPLRALLHRLIEVCTQRNPNPNQSATNDYAPDLAPELEEQLPDYPLWLAHGETVQRLGETLSDLGEVACFAEHPARWLGKGVIQAGRPLEALKSGLADAESRLEAIESALELSGLPSELWDTLEEIEVVLNYAVRLRPLAERGLLHLLNSSSSVFTAFAALSADLQGKQQLYDKAREKNVNWTDPLSPDDTQNALAQARSFEASIFRFLQPAFWRLRKTLKSRYDFCKHAVAPNWVKILRDLQAEQEALAACETIRRQARSDWHADDLPAFIKAVADIRGAPESSHPSARALATHLLASPEANEIVTNLAAIQSNFARLTETLTFILAEHHAFDLPALGGALNSLRDASGVLPDLLPILGELAELPDQFARALRHAPLKVSDFESAIGHKSLNGVYRQERAVSRFEGRTLLQRMGRLEKHYREWLGLNARCIRARVRQIFLEHVNISSLPASQLDSKQKEFKKVYSAGRRDLEHEFGKTMRYKSIRELAAGDSGTVLRDLKPIWLMSPLSVSDTLPLDSDLFDVVIFDEASQIPSEEAVPALYRAHQVIVVGDEMQLPPTSFFAASRADDDTLVVEEEGERIEVDMDSDSFLNQSARNLSSTLLAWHYRSRYEALISFSNAAFYAGNLFTIPDRQRALAERAELLISSPEQGDHHAEALLERSISFHRLEKGIYTDRRNAGEASYIARLVRTLLRKETKLSIGIVAFSEAQQSEIEDALTRLGEEDTDFSARLETEYTREENDQFCGLFIKNLENVQGDERDIIILSICYGYDASGKMLMNFGPINQRGGEKRLNVIFSRARHHMAVVSSIRHHDITNDYNDGAASLKNFLQYAEGVSKGDERAARRVLENLNPLSRKSLAPETAKDAVIDELAVALRSRGYVADTNVGQSRFRCDVAVRPQTEGFYQLGILVDTEAHYNNPNLLDRYLMQPSILRAFGWRFALVLTKDWYHDPQDVLNRLERVLKGVQTDEDPLEELVELPHTPEREKPGSTYTDKSQKEEKGPPEVRPSTSTRYFEFVDGGSSKFWEITLAEKSFTVRFGRLGTAGQTQSKSFADEDRATREAQKLIAEKLKKGYTEKAATP